MRLIDDVLEACGGIDHWKSLRYFTAHVSVDGPLIARKYKAGTLRDIVIEGSTLKPELQIDGFASADQSCIYRPDRITLESFEGRLLMERTISQESFRDGLLSEKWDLLQLLYYVGFLLWNYMNLPFILACPNVVVAELPAARESGQTLRRLKATFPSSITPHRCEQTIYFNSRSLRTRSEYDFGLHSGRRFAQFSCAHQTFRGIIIPTLLRVRAVGSNGEIEPIPPWLDVETFDASFE